MPIRPFVAAVVVSMLGVSCPGSESVLDLKTFEANDSWTRKVLSGLIGLRASTNTRVYGTPQTPSTARRARVSAETCRVGAMRCVPWPWFRTVTLMVTGRMVRVRPQPSDPVAPPPLPVLLCMCRAKLCLHPVGAGAPTHPSRPDLCRRLIIAASHLPPTGSWLQPIMFSAS